MSRTSEYVRAIGDRHGTRQHEDDRWTPCSHPERPLDLDTVFHSSECNGCAFAVKAAGSRSGSVADDVLARR